MSKLILYLILVLVLIASVLGVSSKVVVLKLNYNEGNISLVNSTIKYGFSPDRRYQLDQGYKLEVVSFENEVLHEFRFKAPNEIFVDGTDENGDISGGKIVLDNINFALSIPYYENMKEIKVYSPTNELVGVVSFEAERNISFVKWGIISMITLITIFLLIYIYMKQSKQ